VDKGSLIILKILCDSCRKKATVLSSRGSILATERSWAIQEGQYYLTAGSIQGNKMVIKAVPPSYETAIYTEPPTTLTSPDNPQINRHNFRYRQGIADKIFVDHPSLRSSSTPGISYPHKFSGDKIKTKSSQKKVR
jgi:hypothetical protein